MKTLWLLLSCLKEILELVKNVQANIKENQTQAKVKEDLQKINEAFKSNDAEKLRDVFKS